MQSGAVWPSAYNNSCGMRWSPVCIGPRSRYLHLVSVWQVCSRDAAHPARHHRHLKSRRNPPSRGSSQHSIQCDPERDRRGPTLCLERCLGNCTARAEPKYQRNAVGHTDHEGNLGFNAEVTDSAQPPRMASAAFAIFVSLPVQITTSSLSNGSPSVFYSVTLAATGGLAPYSWTITQGALPNGLTLNATSGVISGTPTDVGTSTFTVQVADGRPPPRQLLPALALWSTWPRREMRLSTFRIKRACRSRATVHLRCCHRHRNL